MLKTIEFQNKDIRFSDTGSGPAIVLLHGYLESLEIWDGFSQRLAENFRVICCDLPGHGKSGILGNTHTMEQLASSVIAVLDHCGINRCMLAGHSMGGYAGLALLELYPERLGGLCLFHSHPYPDKKQTMQNRCREIVLVNQGRKELISKINIPRAFAPDNVEPLKSEVCRATAIALNTPDAGIIACLNGMMKRPSREEILRNTDLPVMLIAGKNDTYISFEDVARQIRLPERGEFVELRNSGHMGFIEEPDISLAALSEWVKSSF
jgi:pimeloyl-ACP methyl ester carboxylesterase